MSNLNYTINQLATVIFVDNSSKEKMRTSTFIINQSEARGMRHFLLKEKPPAGVKEKPPAGVKKKPPQG